MGWFRHKKFKNSQTALFSSDQINQARTQGACSWEIKVRCQATSRVILITRHLINEKIYLIYSYVRYKDERMMYLCFLSAV